MQEMMIKIYFFRVEYYPPRLVRPFILIHVTFREAT